MHLPACVCVFRNARMRLCIHRFEFTQLSDNEQWHKTYFFCCCTFLWKWKMLWYEANCAAILLHQRKKTFLLVKQSSSLSIWLLIMNKLLLWRWSHYKQLLLLFHEKVLTTNNGGVMTPGPTFRWYAQGLFFFPFSFFLCGFGLSHKWSLMVSWDVDV